MTDTKDITELEFDIITQELDKGKDKKSPGRPRNLTLEIYRTFLYYYLHTGLKEWSAAKSQLGIKAYHRLRTSSETFRDVLERDSEDLKVVSLINVSKSIRGVPATYNKDGSIKTPGIQGSVDDSKWALLTLFKEKDQLAGAPNLTPPESKEQVDLMVELLNRHHDYVESKNTNPDKTE